MLQLYIENSLENVSVYFGTKHDKTQREIKHIYLVSATCLCPDITKA